MPRRALVLGATGQIGRATVGRLAADGWRVDAVSRGSRPRVRWPAEWEVRTHHLDRADDAALRRLVGTGCDLLVDCLAYTSRDAVQLVSLGDGVGAAVVISTCMVYRGPEGGDFGGDVGAYPALPVPVREDQPCLSPDDHTYAGGKAAVEQVLLERAPFPVTVLRPGMVHGPHSATPREWYFVKRALDRRPVRLLAYGGAAGCHPSATPNLAELVRAAAARPHGPRVFNAGDPGPPTVRDMAAAVDAALGRTSEAYLLDGGGAPGLGRTPWSLNHPLVMDMARAERELGYRPVCDYAASLPETVLWLRGRVRSADWPVAFPALARRWGRSAFAYAAEDRAVKAGQVRGVPLIAAGQT
ncbi:NAD-dependent epimerase/dehydratase family protein [Streptomyces sp. NPDC087525]|uniref:NAD-dependent epimerase/dehydratase family protein n=1 Tax=Streptomyces sp. NPDC087525 TaxID=3365793 RepID=UPI00382CB711